MRFHVVSHHVPAEEGTAAGRILFATCEGLRAEGHDVRVTSWTLAARSPRWRSLVAPRREAGTLDVAIDDDEIAVADDWLSFPAIERHRGRRVLTLHSLPWLDAATPRSLQDRRAIRRAATRATDVLAYSDRVAATTPRAVTVPAAITVPLTPVPPVEDPVAAVIADWRWPPNDRARRRLLAAWAEVRARVPGARLLVAGRGTTPDAWAGVEVLGEVARSIDVLARAAVVAFPSPPTSGPKVKVLESMAAGVPVVTTPAGVEGIADHGAAFVADGRAFAGVLADVLSDPERRVRAGVAGRAAIERHHAPRPAARARVEALRG